MKILATNKLAYHNYFIEDTFEAGISLEGSEVKSLRQSKVDLKESFVLITRNNELILKNMFISPYEKTSTYKLDEKRDRKLLMHKSEIAKLLTKVQQKGFTLVPLKVYLNGKYIKIQVGLCKGKHTYDKKDVLMEKDKIREMQRDMKNHT